MSQSYRSFEVVVVDDGSTDGSDVVVEAYAAADSRVRMVRQVNSGVSAARNTGMAMASGDYYVLIDADDLWYPNHLSELVSLAEAYPFAGLCSTAFKHHFPYGADVSVVLADLEMRRGLVEDYFECVAKSQFICASTVAIKSSAIDDVGGFEVGAKYGEDLDLWARLALRYPVAYSGRVTVSYVHGVEGQATAAVPVYYSNCHCRTLLSALKDCSVSDERKKHIRRLGTRSAMTVASSFFRSWTLNRAEWRRYLVESRIRNISDSRILALVCLFPFTGLWRPYFMLVAFLASRRYIALRGGHVIRSGVKLSLC